MVEVERERARARAREGEREKAKEKARKSAREIVGTRALSLALSRECEGVKSRVCEQSNVWGDAICVGKCKEAKLTLEDILAVSTS